MKTIFIIYIALVVLAVSACQKKDNAQAVVPTVDSACMTNPALCQPGIYNSPGYYPYPNYGGTAYPYGGGYGQPYGGGYATGYPGYGSGGVFHWTNNSAYLCNCPSGFMPTYNDYGGLGCVQASQIYGGGYGYAYFGWGASNNQWTNIPQISNHTGYSSTRCYNGVVQSCLVDQPNTCAVGYSCRSNSASTRLGLCMATNATSNGSYGPVVR